MKILGVIPARYDSQRFPAKALADIDGVPIGVPVGHAPYNKKTRKEHGDSRIKNALPLQKALNRNLVSIIATVEATGFQRDVAKGFDPGNITAPGATTVNSGRARITARSSVA